MVETKFKSKRKVLKLKRVRCMYPNLDKPKSFQEGEVGKYGIKILIPKTDKASIAPVKAFIKDALQDSATLTAQQKARFLKVALDSKDPYNDNAIIKDGDELNNRAADEEKPVLKERAGHYVIGMNRNPKINAPVVVDQSNTRIPTEAIAFEIQGGYWVHVAATAYIYGGAKPGITLTLDTVMKYKEDEVFAAERDGAFGDDDIEIDDDEDMSDEL